MLKRVAIVSILLFAVALPAAHAADSPVLQVFKQWLDAFNSADAAKMADFWKKYGKTAADDHSPSDLRLRQMTQGMRIFKVVEDTGTHLVVLMKEGRGIYSESTMDLASKNPPTVERISGHPVPPPVEKGDIATSDEDLAKKVRERVAAAQGPNAFLGRS